VPRFHSRLYPREGDCLRRKRAFSPSRDEVTIHFLPVACSSPGNFNPCYARAAVTTSDGLAFLRVNPLMTLNSRGPNQGPGGTKPASRSKRVIVQVAGGMLLYHKIRLQLPLPATTAFNPSALTMAAERHRRNTVFPGSDPVNDHINSIPHNTPALPRETHVRDETISRKKNPRHKLARLHRGLHLTMLPTSTPPDEMEGKRDIISIFGRKEQTTSRSRLKFSRRANSLFLQRYIAGEL
jgi:hypothetical protein